MPGEQASGLDPVDAGVGAEAQSQQPQCLVGGDADLGRSGQSRVHLADTGSPAGVVAVVVHVGPDLVCGPVDLDAAHHPHQRPSRSASYRVTTASSIRSARYERRRAPLSAQAFEVSDPSPLAFLASPVARWQGANPRRRAAAGGVALSQEASGPGRAPRQITVPRTPMSSICCRMPRML